MSGKLISKKKISGKKIDKPNRTRNRIVGAMNQGTSGFGSRVGDSGRNNPTERRMQVVMGTAEQNKLLVQILGIINRQPETKKCISEILSSIKRYGQFEAVGIRIKSGEDYPYYQTSGFPGEFVLAEMNLCSVNYEGNVERDSDGNVCLECMCGNIICGRTTTEFPCFTKGGSFWSNSTTKMLASTSVEARALLRNRCNSEGYESVALVPLKSGDEIIGLLQLNDRRENMFTIEDIEFYEELGNSIGIAIERQNNQSQLTESENQRAAFMDSAGEAFHLVDSDFNITEINRIAIDSLLVYRDDIKNKDDIIGMNIFKIYPFLKQGSIRNKMMKVLKTSQSYSWESMASHSLRGELYYSAQIFKVNDGLGFVLTDITERKHSLVMLEEANAIVNRSSSMAFTWQNKKGWPVDFVTENVRRVLGYTAQEFINGVISYETCIHPDDVQRVGQEVELFSSDSRRTEFVHEPYRLVRKDGSCLIVNDWTAIIRNEEGEITHYRGFVEDITERELAEEELKKKSHELSGRVKELNCLYSVLQMNIDPDYSVSEVIQGVVDIIPSSCQYPEITCARVVISDQTYTTVNFVETEWKFTTEIFVKDKVEGSIEVYYTKEMPELTEGPFQIEERSLINALCEAVGSYLERKQAEEKLHSTNLRLIGESQSLQESNIALKEVMATIEVDKKDSLLRIQSNINRIVLPLVQKLKASANSNQEGYFQLLEDNLNDVTSPFISKLESQFARLSPREVEICKMLTNGMTSKEIATALNTSTGTVFNQRKTIRKKLGIRSDNVNLVSFLKTI